MNVLDVMGDFMYPETLARVAKVSKRAHSFITPILDRKRADSDEMCQMLRRMLTNSEYLPKGMSSFFYNMDQATALLLIQTKMDQATALLLIQPK
jgi:hypothetical protein